MNDAMVIAAMAAGLLAFALGCRWVDQASRRPHGRVVAFLERLRRAAAYEDDDRGPKP